MDDKNFQTQTDTKNQEKNKLTKLMEGFDDFYKGYNKENSDKQIANLLTSLMLFINGEDDN